MAEYATEVKMFGKWTFDDIEVSDISLADYVACKPDTAVFAPHTAGRYAAKRFRKALCPIVERMATALMFHGRNSGKKLLAMRIMKSTLEIIHLLTDENPMQVRSRANARAAPAPPGTPHREQESKREREGEREREREASYRQRVTVDAGLRVIRRLRRGLSWWRGPWCSFRSFRGVPWVWRAIETGAENRHTTKGGNRPGRERKGACTDGGRRAEGSSCCAARPIRCGRRTAAVVVCRPGRRAPFSPGHRGGDVGHGPAWEGNTTWPRPAPVTSSA
jgi:ribosomal protein uS7